MSNLRRLLAATGILIVTATGLAVTSTPAYATIVYTHQLYNKGDRECVYLQFPQTGVPLYQSVCFEGDPGAPDAWWDFRDFANGARMLVNWGTNLCMAATGLYNGAPVVDEPCDSFAGVYWSTTIVDSTAFMIKVFNTNYCLDLENGDTTYGVPMQVWTCNSHTNNQKWIYQPEQFDF